MARKRRQTLTAPRPEPSPDWAAHIGRDPKDRLHFLSFQAHGGGPAGGGYTYTEVALAQIGRPFQIAVPSAPGHGNAGMVIEGLTGSNAEPWSPSQVLAAARFGMFGFRLVTEAGGSHGSPAPEESPHLRR